MTAPPPPGRLPPDPPGEGAVLPDAPIAVIGAAGAVAIRPARALNPGDTLVTAAGGTATLRAVLRRRADPARHKCPERLAPVRLAPGALGPGEPFEPLLLPPEALILPPMHGAGLVPAAALANGTTIARAAPEAHGWLVLDCGPHAVIRAAGAGIGTARLPDPGAEPRPGAARAPRVPPCLPVLPPLAPLADLRRRLAGAAPRPPHAPPAEPPSGPPAERPVAVLASGAEIPLAEAPDPLTLIYALPAGTGPLRLRSRPRRAADAADTRRFGICLRAVELDGRPLPLDGPAFGPGFHPAESNEHGAWRWTNGDAWLVLPYATAPRRLRLALTDWHRALAPG
jgi:hypothetical protein